MALDLGPTVLGRVFSAGWRDPVKLDKGKKSLMSTLACFLAAIARVYFLGTALGYISIQSLDFPNISLFFKIPSREATREATRLLY